MANITAELAAIMAAIYGEEVRGSIHDAIDKINKASEKAISSGSAFAPGDSAVNYPSGSLYLNTTSNKLLRSNGSTWEDAGDIKGETGLGIESITKTETTGLVDTYTIEYSDGTTSDFDVTNGNGIVSIDKTGTVGLVDTYTITYTDGTTEPFEVTNGKGISNITKTSTAGLVDTYTITYTDNTTATFDVTNGTVGNKWYRGTVISGKSINPTVFPSSGITDAQVNDFYMNVTEGAVYHCALGGVAATATWVYDFTLTGGGSSGASSWGDLTDKPFTYVDTDDNLKIENNTLHLNIPNKVNTFNATEATFDTVVASANNKDFIVKAVDDSIELYQKINGEAVPFVAQSGAATWSELTGKPFATVTTDDNLKITGDALTLDIPNKVNTFGATEATFDTVVAAADESDFIVKNGATSSLYQKQSGVAVPIGGGGGGHEMISTTPEDVLLATKAENKVVNAFVMADFANVYTECLVATLNSGESVIGKWFEEGETWDTTQMWVEPQFAETNGEQLHFEFDFWVGEQVTIDATHTLHANSKPLHLSGYQWDSTAGALTIKCGETAPNDISVIVKVTHVRER